MIRKFELSGDNLPSTTNFQITVGSEETPNPSGTLTVETGTQVSWAMITESNVSITNNTPNKGPYYMAGTGSASTYDVQSISLSLTFAEDSLQIYLNGLLLELDTDYQELDDHRFEFIVGGTGLSENPQTDDVIGIVFREEVSASGALGGSENISISKIYPDLTTGFEVTYSDFSDGDVVNLNVIYR